MELGRTRIADRSVEASMTASVIIALALATAAAPTLPRARGRLSTTIGWPSRDETSLRVSRGKRQLQCRVLAAQSLE
jgi:hypothetical protein